MNENEIRQAISRYKFYHIIQLTENIATPGHASCVPAQNLCMKYLNLDDRPKAVNEMAISSNAAGERTSPLAPRRESRVSAESNSPPTRTPSRPAPGIAVLIPCYNEEAAISSVVRNFRRALPTADIYVYDNNSKDRTIEVASAAGAIVQREPLQGKGNVVRRMFADVEADVFVLVDGDETSPCLQ